MSTLRVNNLESLTSGTIASVEEVVEPRAIRVTSIAEMGAYSVPAGYVFSLNDGGRSGTFDVISGDFSAELAADTLNGIYVGLDDDPTALTKVARRAYSGPVDVTWFGAKGDGDQSLYNTNYLTDNNESSNIVQQTRDAIAINSVIRLGRVFGEVSIHIPSGVYRTYAYLEPLNYPVKLTGAGPGVTELVNCDSSPNENGYGIIMVDPGTVSEVTIADITLDGKVLERGKPTFEIRAYPLAFHGKPVGFVSNVVSKNSPIDCFYTGYENDNAALSMHVVNCVFSDAFRNTVSLVSGWNQSYVGCDISGAGVPFNGTNPRYGLDIEPKYGTRPIKNIVFSACKFSRSLNVTVGGVWCTAKFLGCTFDNNKVETGSGLLTYFRQGQISFSGCKFEGDKSTRNSFLHFPLGRTVGAFQNDQYVSLSDCVVDGAGIQVQSVNSIFSNVTVLNSGYPFIIQGNSSDNEKQRVTIHNLSLINVFDSTNAGIGTYSSFVIKSTFKGPLLIDGVNIDIDKDSLVSSGVPVSSSRAFGFTGETPSDPSGSFIIRNVHSSGFYKTLPDALGIGENINNYRDWRYPNIAPFSGGLFQSSPDGTQTDFSFNHGLTHAPETITLVPGNLNSSRLFYATTDDTQIHVTFSTAPDAGSIKLFWTADTVTKTKGSIYYENCSMYGNNT